MISRPALRLVGIVFGLASSALATPSAWAIVRGFRPSVRQYPMAERIVSVVELGAKCTGVLLDERIVLTAAHCDTSSEPMGEGMAPHTTRELKRLSAGYTVFGQGFDPVRAVDAVILKSHWL